LLDIKSKNLKDFEDAIKLATRYSFDTRIIIQCGNFEIIKRLREKYPKIGVLARAFSISEVFDYLKLHPDIVQVDEAWINDQTIDEIHHRGAKVLIKTLDSLGDTIEHRDQLFRRGVDIVLTDQRG